MRKTLYQMLFRFLGVKKLYEKVVVQNRFDGVKNGIRKDITALLESANQNNPFFLGKFTAFLSETRDADDKAFFAAYAKLPALTKQDYAGAGQSVMTKEFADIDPETKELRAEGTLFSALRRLRGDDYLMPMATGGSSSLPLIVWMTKHHMFTMLFTFFKCWYRMGWRPGEKMLIFYPRNTYNIDDMVKFNRYSRLTGFRYHLFDHINEETVRALVDDINTYKPKLWLVFPSPLNMIAHTIRRFQIPLKYHPPLINVSGETFFDCQRKNIEEVFTGSNVEDSYGSVELGEIAHETENGLEIFGNAAYVETEPNEAGQPEMVVTSLTTTDFPFIRYKMKDIADVEFVTDSDGNELFVIRKIEGKDSNFIMSEDGRRFYPSFFNGFVNQLNSKVDNTILEIKVYERDQTELEVQFIIRDDSRKLEVEQLAREFLQQELGAKMHYRIRFVDFIDHDYRRKYRVIERIGDVEFAGGMVGDQRKDSTVSRVESETLEAMKNSGDQKSPAR